MLLIMLVSILINYVFGIGVGRSEGGVRKLWLAGGLACNLGLLLYYKYANFFVDNYNLAASSLGISPILWETVVLPLGISFFTFHGMSYVIDVYRKTTVPQENPLTLALYVSFFPQLIAGPIIRYKDVAHQFGERIINAELFSEGVRRFILGLAKKILLANMLGRVPHYVYEMPVDQYNGWFNWLTMIAGGLQMYYDFSGYSDMAIGLAKMFGFNFKENFNFPYTSLSMKEFWTRWHISLSSWFRDYLYIPLGGNRHGAFRTYLNLWIVFLLNGLWHGANWTFILFGCIHGFFLTVERIGLSRLLEKIPRIFRNMYTFLVFSCSIVLFNMRDLDQSGKFFAKMLQLSPPDKFSRLYLCFTPEWFFILLVAILLCGPMPGKITDRLLQRIAPPPLVRIIKIVSLFLLFLLSMAELANGSYNPFIYFRF